MDIFVGNLSFSATEDDVKKLFEGFGNVASVVIVMRKEKRVSKSRGFGFVQMPDEQQALAAIAALNGKEFMGRVLNVNPARSKTGAQAENKLKEQGQPKALVEVRQHLVLKDGQVRPTGQHLVLKDGQVRPTGRPGTYRSGRRTHSYVKRQRLAGLPEEAKPRKRSQDNPMRWRKKKPWQKKPGEHKPWQKAEGEARPWKRPEGDARPWRKSEGGAKPWQKSRGEHKPWKKTEGEARPWKRPEGDARPWRKSEGGVKPWKKRAGDAKPWKKPAGDAKPWKKPEGEFKPWRKRTGESKPWRKSSKRPRPRQSRIESRRKPGGYTR